MIASVEVRNGSVKSENSSKCLVFCREGQFYDLVSSIYLLNRLIQSTEITLDITQQNSHSLILFLQNSVLMTILLSSHI